MSLLKLSRSQVRVIAEAVLGEILAREGTHNNGTEVRRLKEIKSRADYIAIYGARKMVLSYSDLGLLNDIAEKSSFHLQMRMGPERAQTYKQIIRKFKAWFEENIAEASEEPELKATAASGIEPLRQQVGVRQAYCTGCGKHVNSDPRLKQFIACPEQPVDCYYCGCNGWH